MVTTFAGFVGWVWYRLSRTRSELENRGEYRHGSNIPLGVSYYGKYYLYRNDRELKAFSTTCTHAGCRIHLSGSGSLQCGCHGSSFDAASGMPMRGPAIRPLQRLECRFDDHSGEWVILLPAKST